MSSFSRRSLLASLLGLSLSAWASPPAGPAASPAHCQPGAAKPTPRPDPEADKALAKFVSDRVSVSGSVKQVLQLGVADLKRFPPQLIKDLSMTCLSGADMGKTGKLRGALLRDILNKAQLDAPGHNDVKRMVVIATATDGYTVVFSWAEVFNNTVGDGIVVYYEKDGQALGNDEGHIAMVSTSDTRTGPRHVKWLRSLEIRKVPG
jgi:DMSO/TMAO reductase YedYZ molybdopterin-dependent catalytic subunit